MAAYGTGAQQSLWFFSVPADIFAASQASAAVVGSSWLRASSREQQRNIEWMSWWPDDGLQEWLNHAGDPVAGVLPTSIWPVKIRGQEIGACEGITDLAIDSDPDMMTIWAFCRGGIGKSWKIGSRSPSKFTLQNCLTQRETMVRQLLLLTKVHYSSKPRSYTRWIDQRYRPRW